MMKYSLIAKQVGLNICRSVGSLFGYYAAGAMYNFQNPLLNIADAAMTGSNFFITEPLKEQLGYGFVFGAATAMDEFFSSRFGVEKHHIADTCVSSAIGVYSLSAIGNIGYAAFALLLGNNKLKGAEQFFVASKIISGFIGGIIGLYGSVNDIFSPIEAYRSHGKNLYKYKQDIKKISASDPVLEQQFDAVNKEIVYSNLTIHVMYEVFAKQIAQILCNAYALNPITNDMLYKTSSIIIEAIKFEHFRSVSAGICSKYFDVLQSLLYKSLLQKIFCDESSLKLEKLKSELSSIKDLHSIASNIIGIISDSTSHSMINMFTLFGRLFNMNANDFSIVIVSKRLSGLHQKKLINAINDAEKQCDFMAENMCVEASDAATYAKQITEQDGMNFKREALYKSFSDLINYNNNIYRKNAEFEKVKHYIGLFSKIFGSALLLSRSLGELVKDALHDDSKLEILEKLFALDMRALIEVVMNVMRHDLAMQQEIVNCTTGILSYIGENDTITKLNHILANKVESDHYAQDYKKIESLIRIIDTLDAMDVHYDVNFQCHDINKYNGIVIPELAIYCQDNLLSKINDLYIKPGIHAITGKSGCGKSTFLSILKGFPTLGDVRGSGEVYYPSTSGAHDKSKIKFMTQSDYFAKFITLKGLLCYPYQDNIFTNEEIANVLNDLEGVFDERKNENIPEKSLLSSRIEEYQDDWNDKVSGGQKKKIQLARLILHSFKNSKDCIFVIDEGLTGLDEISQKSALRCIKKYLGDKIVMIVDHEMQSHSDIMSGDFYIDEIHFERGGNVKVFDIKDHHDITDTMHIPDSYNDYYNEMININT
ncbi:MAG: ATP-binding cassette domain-containing protein [Proteobacteria bacterium]|nr:ATP-binding cassette domain-containing protein [Pseudomonadota bacterium]